MSDEQNNQNGSIDDVVNSSGADRSTPAANATTMGQTSSQSNAGEQLPPLRLPTLLPLDKYISLFTKSYSTDPDFKDKVHNYLKLSKFKKVGLSLGKVFRKSWYDKKTQEMISAYATKAHDDLEKYCNAKRDAWEAKKKEIELKKQQAALSESEKKFQLTQQEYKEATAKEQEERERARLEFEAKQRAIEERAEKQKAQIIHKTDVNRIVQEHLQKSIEKSSYVKVDASGNLQFDEQQIVQRLEDLYLDQIIDGIEKEDGKTGFITKVLKEYGDILSHFEELGDISDIADVDWTQSIQYSAAMGYRRPTFPYLVVGKKQPKTAHGKIQLDTAQILDISGSMTHNNRINIAKKTLLANSALMRRLNPSNNMYMGVYSDAVKDVTSSDLFRSVAADGYTRTDLALEWLLGKLEKTGEPSIAYLVTDGEPYHPNVSNMMERCINYAERFKKLPIMLTIFLVDGDASSEANIIEIGQAAGSDTKVIPVEVDDLGSGVIRAGADNIHQMYSIGDFARR